MALGEMYLEYMPLSKIRFARRNPKDHDVGGIATSEQKFGFNSPPTLDENTEELVAGHGRIKGLRALKADGAEPPKRIKVEGSEWLVPVIRGISFEDADEAEAYLMADNRWGELGGWNEDLKKEVLQDLAARDRLDGVGWDREDVDALLREDSRSTSTVEVNFEASVGGREHVCPNCNHRFTEAEEK